MILFYDKETGKIVGTVNGRIHNKHQLRMHIGDPSQNDKMVVEWSKVIDAEGNETFEPNTTQKDLFGEFDSGKARPTDYKINLNTKEIVKDNGK